MSLGFWSRAFSFLLITNQTLMKTQQTTISEVKLVYKSKVKAADRQQIRCSKDAFDIFMVSWDLDSIDHVEEFKLLLVNRVNSVHLRPEYLELQRTGFSSWLKFKLVVSEQMLSPIRI